jgi:hypothetical protein
MGRKRPPWTQRQVQQLRHLANYLDYLSEKASEYESEGKPLPEPLRNVLAILPGVKERIVQNDFDSPAELWREVENRIVEWYLQESKQWKPGRHEHRPDSPQS